MGNSSEEFAILVKQEHKRLVNWLRKRTHNHHVAEDIAQNTYLKVWQKVARYEPVTHSLLFKVAWQQWRDYVKAERAEKRPVTFPLEDALDKPEVRSVLDEWEDATDTVIRVANLVLTEPQRDVIAGYVAGHTTRDIAEMLNLSVQAVKRRLHDARKRIA